MIGVVRNKQKASRRRSKHGFSNPVIDKRDLKHIHITAGKSENDCSYSFILYTEYSVPRPQLDIPSKKRALAHSHRGLISQQENAQCAD